jgi:hypothetical protein
MAEFPVHPGRAVLVIVDMQLQRTACAVMAFGFAEVTSVDEVRSRSPATAAT